MTYDKENRMTVYNQDGVRTTYLYSGNGTKRTEIVGGVTTTLLWDEGNYFADVTGGSYSNSKRYYAVGDQMVSYESTADVNTRKDYLTDHLGSITNEFDQTEMRTYEARYLPYGLNQWSSGTPGAFAWIGSWGYRATGLFRVSHYVRARHYSNQTQAWTSVDPIWPDQFAYSYVMGYATSRIDFWGLQVDITPSKMFPASPGITLDPPPPFQWYPIPGVKPNPGKPPTLPSYPPQPTPKTFGPHEKRPANPPVPIPGLPGIRLYPDNLNINIPPRALPKKSPFRLGGGGLTLNPKNPWDDPGWDYTFECYGGGPGSPFPGPGFSGSLKGKPGGDPNPGGSIYYPLPGGAYLICTFLRGEYTSCAIKYSIKF